MQQCSGYRYSCVSGLPAYECFANYCQQPDCGIGDMALAGMGVAMKITMITGMICIGFGQGIQPLLGYCGGRGNVAAV